MTERVEDVLAEREEDVLVLLDACQIPEPDGTL